MWQKERWTGGGYQGLGLFKGRFWQRIKEAGLVTAVWSEVAVEDNIWMYVLYEEEAQLEET